MKKFGLLFISICLLQISGLNAQTNSESSFYFGIPTKTVGIGFGNSPIFNGIRINIADRHVEQINGINFTIWNSKENTDADVNGIQIASSVIRSDNRISGISIVPGYLKAEEYRGLALVGYSNTSVMTGLSIALFNNTKELHGVQVGILNYAGNNRKGTKLLPILNIH